MKNLSADGLNPQEEMRASTELLRLKLKLDHDMIISDTPGLSPEVENQWLSNIYEFETKYGKSKRIKVVDLLGRPIFPKWDLLNKEETHRQLEKLLTLLEEKQMALDCCCEYDDRVIYRFITEELFDHEVDAVFMEGMVYHFIYEEFHPNHDYDLRRHTKGFIESILQGNWNVDFDKYQLANLVSFNGRVYSQAIISEMIVFFQEAHSFFEIEKIEIANVEFDLDKSTGHVLANLIYVAHLTQGKGRLVSGPCIIKFKYDSSDWDIVYFEFPGMEN